MSTKPNEVVKIDGKVCPACGNKVSTYQSCGSYVKPCKPSWEELYESLIYENDPACEPVTFDND